MTRPCEAVSFVGDEQGEEVTVPCTNNATMITATGSRPLCADCHAKYADYPSIQAEYVPIEGATE